MKPQKPVRGELNLISAAPENYRCYDTRNSEKGDVIFSKSPHQCIILFLPSPRVVGALGVLSCVFEAILDLEKCVRS